MIEMSGLSIAKWLIPTQLLPIISQLYRTYDFFMAYFAKVMKRRHLTVRIDTVDSCNMKCQYCYTLGLPTSKSTFMSLEQFNKIADELFPIAEHVYLSCAWEPTMNKNFHEVIRISGKYNIPFLSFVTNGALLSDDIIDASISANVNEIKISIDAAEEDKFNDITQSKLFNHVIESMQKLHDKKRDANSLLPRVVVQCVVFKENSDQTIMLIKNYQHLFDKICISGLLHRRRNDIDNYERLLPHELKEIALQCDKLADKSTTIEVGMRNKSLRPLVCGMPLRYLLIRSNGDVVLCHKEVIGNIFTARYRQIIRNNKHLLRKLVLLRTNFCQTECDIYS